MSSRRQYLSQTELTQYADITITDATEADDQISQAEEMIDAYVGFQCKAVPEVYFGKASGATANTITLEAGRHQNVFQNNFFMYCELEIVGGTGVGQRQIITASTLAGMVTLVGNFSVSPDTTSYYKIYQLGKFPRIEQDVWYDGIHTPTTYVKSIPEAVKRAVAAQVQYMIKMGSNFFATDATAMQSEHIGDYSYSRASSGMGKDALIAPKAKQYLNGIMNRKGIMTVNTDPSNIIGG